MYKPETLKFYVDGELVKEVEDEVLEAVQEAKSLETAEGNIGPVVEKKVDRYLVNSLRKLDPEHKHTCSKCCRRLALDKFARHKLSDVCMECEA